MPRFFNFAVSVATFLLAVVSVFLVDLILYSPSAPPPDTKVTSKPSARDHYDFFDIGQPKTQPDVPSAETQTIRCTDRVRKPLLAILMKSKKFREDLYPLTDEHDCTKLYEVRQVDLNGDGTKEILLRGPPCGAVGNCRFWVFDKRSKRFRILLSSSDYIDRSEMGKQVQRLRTHRYRDLLVTGHFSASDTSFTNYKFNGKKYVESRCRYETPDYSRGNNPVRWHFVPCDKFYRDLKLN